MGERLEQQTGYRVLIASAIPTALKFLRSYTPASLEVPPTEKSLPHSVMSENALHGLLPKQINDGIHIPTCLLVDSNLPVCPSALWILDQGAKIVHLPPTTQVKQLMQRLAHAHATILEKVDHFSIQA